MNVVRDISYFVHEYNFDYTMALRSLNEQIIDKYQEINKDKNQENFSDIYIENIFVDNILTTKLVKLIGDNYYAGDYTVNTGIKIKVMDNNSKEYPTYNNHILSPCNICGIFFVDIPNIGGEVEFSIEEGKIIMKPEPNKIYLFPNWLQYRHLKQEDVKPRICFTFE